MKRRALLTSMGVGMAGLAGCLGGSSGGGGNNNANAGKKVNPARPSGKGPEFDLLSLDVPDEAQVGKGYSFEVTVENTGEHPGVYQAPVKTKTSDNTQYRTQVRARVYLEPGTEKTATITLPAFNSVETVDIRFGSPQNTWSVDIVPPELAMGESFEVDGFEITYLSVAFTDTIRYEGGQVPYENTAGSGEKFAVARVRLTSLSGSSNWLTDTEQYTLQVGDIERGMVTSRGYPGGSLPTGQTTTFEIPYKVPADTSKSDLVFYYEGQREDRSASWSPGFSTDSDTGDETTDGTTDGTSE